MKQHNYYKTVHDSLSAHLYEHIIANKIDSYLFQNNYLQIVDYDFWAYTLGNTIAFTLKFYNSDCEKDFLKCFSSPFDIKESECMRALEECSIEYSRNYVCDMKAILQILSKYEHEPFVPKKLFKTVMCNEIMSSNYTPATKGVEYGNESVEDFSYAITEYVVSKEFFKDNRELKPLAMMLIQAISLNHLRETCRTYRAYDSGDEWERGVDRLAYRNYISFRNDNFPELDSFYQTTHNNLVNQNNKKLIPKLNELLTVKYSKESDYYFDDSEMFSISKMIIGADGWKNLASISNLRLVIENLSIKILYADEDRELKQICELLD